MKRPPFHWRVALRIAFYVALCYTTGGGVPMNDKDRFLSLDFSEIFFDWDDAKEQRNFIKHGVRFRTVVKVNLWRGFR